MKTKHLPFLALLLCLSSPIFSQSSSSLDLSVGLERGFRTLSNEGLAPFREENEIPDLGYRFGIHYNRQLSQQLWLRTGLRYAIIKYKQKVMDDIRWASEFDPDTGVWTPDPNLPRQLQAFTSFHFFEVPLRLRYVFSQGRWQPYGEGGMSALLFRHWTTEVVTDRDASKVKDPNDDIILKNDLQFALLLAFGTNFTLNDRLALFAQVNYSHHLTPTFDTEVKERLYTIGLETGLRVDL